MKGFINYIPAKFIFGSGVFKELSKQKMPGKKALVVISNGKSTRANGYLDTLEKQLKSMKIDWVVFDKVEPNPLKDTVMAGAKVSRDNGCDFVIALGGGSVMDAAKAIAAMSTNDGDLWDYIQFGTGKRKTFARPALPLVAISTTAGTGSELDAGGVITNPQTNEKTAVFGESLFPVLAIVDPDLTLTVPPRFTAYQGFDALFHSTEGYISAIGNPMCDLYALGAIENISKYLARAVKDGKDLEARQHVSFGNSLSGMVMTVGSCVSEHSLEHALSAYHQELPHGAGLIMISLAYYKKLIELKVCPERFIKMARVMGIENADKPEDFLTALKNLQEACGVADLKMSDYSISESEFEKFVKNAKTAMAFLFECDRVKLSDVDCLEIYKNSYR